MVGSNSYSVLLVADNGGGTQQHLYALVVNGVAAPPPVAQWRQAYWGTTNNLGPAANDADPDADGLHNLLEYALRRNPNAADSAGAFSLMSTNPAGVSFSLSLHATDLTAQVEQNPAGLHTNEWTPAGIMETRATNGSFIEVRAWVTNPMPATLNHLFLRLRATVP
jgi:hypothetical protein